MLLFWALGKIPYNYNGEHQQSVLNIERHSEEHNSILSYQMRQTQQQEEEHSF